MQGATPHNRLDALQADNTAFDFLAARLPVADLTAAAIAGELPTAVVDEPPIEQNGNGSQLGLFERLTRALYRRSNRHVLLTGLKGVGKTTIVRELARRAANGKIPFLADRRFLWIDAKNVGPEDSRGCLETILAVTEEQPQTVLCLDGLDALLKRPQGGTNKPLRHPGRPNFAYALRRDGRHAGEHVYECEESLEDNYSRARNPGGGEQTVSY